MKVLLFIQGRRKGGSRGNSYYPYILLGVADFTFLLPLI